MSDIIALLGEGQILLLPPFMRADPAAFSERCQVKDWWHPIRSDNETADFASGAVHFAAAVHFGKHVRDDALANICGQFDQFGAVELGFLDALARKATVGIVPKELDEAFLRETADTSDGRLTVQSFRDGEANAVECLNLARELRFPALINVELQDAIAGKYGRAGFIWTVCRAAMTGGVN